MAKANKQTTKIRRKGAAKVKSLQDLPPFEPKYLMRVNAADVSGDISHGDLVLLARDELPQAGDLVCVHPKQGFGGPVLVNLDTGVSEIDWKRMPFELSAADGCVSVLMGTVFGSTRQFVAPMDKLLAVHKCEGRYDPEQATA
jgi:hypothetical protein